MLRTFRPRRLGWILGCFRHPCRRRLPSHQELDRSLAGMMHATRRPEFTPALSIRTFIVGARQAHGAVARGRPILADLPKLGCVVVDRRQRGRSVHQIVKDDPQMPTAGMLG